MKNLELSNKNIEDIVEYLKLGTIRTGLDGGTSPQSIARFKQLASQFSLNQSALMCGEKTVIASENIDAFLQEIYNNPATRLNGRDRFYARIALMTYGITKSRVMAFLNKMELHQLHLQRNHASTIKPIVMSRLHQRYQVDLIDMSNYARTNGGIHFILMCVDVFSKYLWARPLKNKEGTTVAACMDKLLSELRESVPPVHPAQIQSDRGSEFTSAEWKQVMVKYNVKSIYSRAYTPQSQGCVERTNRTIKAAIHQHFTFTGAQKYIDTLEEIVSNYNHSLHGTTKQMPVQVNSGAKESAVIAGNNIKLHAKKLIDEEACLFSDLAVGDYVRIHIDTTAESRKDTFKKRYVPQWSREVYQISSIFKPRKEFSEHAYYVKGKSNQYRRDELQKVPPPSDIVMIPPKPKVLRILPSQHIPHPPALNPAGTIIRPSRVRRAPTRLDL